MYATLETRPLGLTQAEATERAIRLAEVAGAPLYVVHVTNAAAMNAIRQSRARGHLEARRVEEGIDD